jgi:hypothetical protein
MLNWNTDHANNRIIHTTLITESGEEKVLRAMESCVDKSIGLLKNLIQSDSLYLLFEWDSNTAVLNIVVTDGSKTDDSPESVCCVFSGVQKELRLLDETQKHTYADNVKFWLHDYLTVCTAFFNYSLVAIFHSSTREHTELL